ncbi:MAG: FecR domain-containing protein [Chloroflexi bacterium]|nr:FecR domain-containing protein [Chloroflexota bacterium]
METVAWIVLWTAFGIAGLLAVGLLAGIRWYYVHALEPRPAQAQTIGGTLLVRSPIDLSWVSLPSRSALREGQAVRTDGTSQALLTLFDDSTIVISSGTELRLARMGASRFTGARHVVRLTLAQGRIHIGVAPARVPEQELVVSLPGGTVHLAEGSYTLIADRSRGYVRVGERGSATVQAGRSAPMTLLPGQRVQWSADGETGGPETAADELIYNGDFAWGLQGWRVGTSLGFPEGSDVEGQVIVTTGPEGQPVVRFQRRYSGGTHYGTYLFQTIDRDVSDYATLTLTLTFQVNYQSLSGGGYMGTEYPLAVQVVYRAANGEEHTYVTGFYYHNVTDNRTDSGQRVPQNQWQTVTIPLKTLTPPPQRILSVQVSASGWDYQSEIQSVSLAGQ